MSPLVRFVDALPDAVIKHAFDVRHGLENLLYGLEHDQMDLESVEKVISEVKRLTNHLHRVSMLAEINGGESTSFWANLGHLSSIGDICSKARSNAKKRDERRNRPLHVCDSDPVSNLLEDAKRVQLRYKRWCEYGTSEDSPGLPLPVTSRPSVKESASAILTSDIDKRAITMMSWQPSIRRRGRSRRYEGFG